MGLISMMGDSLGCSATGERLVSAARDGDFQETKALLEYNPRLAKYSTFGVRNSPLHYSAARGHHEIVSLLIESGVDMNLRNYRGQTALMQACLHGHWKVVQTLILFKANINKKDYLSGGTAIHFAAQNGHSRCVRLLVADYVPSISEFWNFKGTKDKDLSTSHFFDEVFGGLYDRKFQYMIFKSQELTTEQIINLVTVTGTILLVCEQHSSALSRVVDKKADGGIASLHLAALNGHAECVQLLLDLGASVSDETVQDGSTIDLIGAGSTPLHYAACGGNAVCCQLLIGSGASLTAKNANGLTPLMVARSWHRNGLEGILSKQPQSQILVLPSPYLSLPLMSIVKIARECGWRRPPQSPSGVEPCVICLEMKCTVAAEGCDHEFCTKCALYLCSTSTSATSSSKRAPPGSIPCPFCRHPIISFSRLTTTSPIKLLSWPKNSTSLGPTIRPFTGTLRLNHSVDLGCTSLRSVSFRKLKGPSICNNSDSETTPCLVSCLRPDLQRSASHRANMSRRSSSRIPSSP